VRWSLALVTSTTVLGAVYHYGTNSREKWTYVAPGAITATLLWFPTTLAFGVYVTRLADYTVIYGSLGTGIATLVWLYLTSFSILLGAQLNGVLYRGRRQVATAARVAAYRDAVNSSIAAGQSSTSHAGISIAGTNHAGTPTSEQTVSPISGSV
jgi:membrane protein